MQNDQNKLSESRFYTAGYWFGGILCVLGLLSFSLGLIPLINTVRRNNIVVHFPGKNVVDLKLPGAYLALGIASGFSPADLKLINDLNYSLTNKDQTDTLPIAKLPQKQYATDNQENQMPLFQFVIDKAGVYFLEAAYPFNLEEPKISALLFHIDVRYVRTELIVGIIVCLILVGLGIYLIRKSYKLQNPKGTPAP